jgi:PAS domain S-box-containing protein
MRIDMSNQILDSANYFFNPYAIPALVIAAMALVISLRHLIGEKFSLAANALALLGIVISFWLVSNFFTYSSKVEAVSIWWAKMSNIGISFIPSGIYYFAVVVLRIDKKHRATIWTGWVLSTLFSIAALKTDLIVKGVVHYAWGYQGAMAPTNTILIAYMLTFYGLGLRHFWIGQKQAVPDSAQHHRIKAYLLAFGIGSLGLVDYLAGLGIPVFPFGFLGIFAALWMLETTITRYRLVDISPRFAAQGIIDTMNDALLVLDAEGVIRLVNKTTTRVLGHPATELTGRHLSAIFHDGVPVERMAAPARMDPDQQLELSYDNPDGRKQILSFSASSMKDGSNRLLANVYIVRDITALRQAEIELRRSRDELELRVRERTADLITSNEQLTREIAERKKISEERVKLVAELQDALDNVKTLRGLIPICASCKKIRDDNGYWNQIEAYLSKHSLAEFSHGICPQCAKKIYPQFYK